MSDAVLLFVNERPVRIAAGAQAREAVAALDPALAQRLSAGEAYLTDGRGIRLESDSPVFAGAILRVVVSARSTTQGREADAHA